LCLLVAGWDGNTIPLAVVPLFAGMPKRGTLTPHFAIPMTWDGEQTGQLSQISHKSVAQSLIALHLDAYESRLWILSAGKVLHLWDARRLAKLGHWALPSDIENGKFDGRAMCLDSTFRLVIVGEDASGPRLVRTMLAFSNISNAARREHSQDPKVAGKLSAPYDVSVHSKSKAFLRN